MKREIKRIGLLVILPLLLASFALYNIGEAAALPSEEDPVLIRGIPPVLGSEDEPRTPPIIGIIGIER